MMSSAECPFANIAMKISTENPKKLASLCPVHSHQVPERFFIQEEVPIVIRNGTHQVSEGTARLLADIGGGDRIREFCTRFYARAFLDETLKPFFFNEDGATAHGKRLADWIIQKMGGEGEPWSESGRWGMRQPSHHAAWNSQKRAEDVRGRHFQLDESRIWMRLHFWAMRECGLQEHEPFWHWYIQFIEHFIKIYERSAAQYAEVDAAWSANPANIQKYLEDGHMMKDILANPRKR